MGLRSQETIDDVVPKAAPTEEDERQRGLAQAVEDGFSSGFRDKSSEDIVVEAELSAD